jgi:hypothetical protein
MVAQGGVRIIYCVPSDTAYANARTAPLVAITVSQHNACNSIYQTTTPDKYH